MKKIINILSHLGNANQNSLETLPHPSQNLYHQLSRTQIAANANKDGENKFIQPLWKSVWKFLKELKIC
jgi:hypothetical protein